MRNLPFADMKYKTESQTSLWIFYICNIFVIVPFVIHLIVSGAYSYAFDGAQMAGWLSFGLGLMLCGALCKSTKQFFGYQLKDQEILLAVPAVGAKKDQKGRTLYKVYGPSGFVWLWPWHQVALPINTREKRKVKINYTVSTSDDDVTVTGFLFYVPDLANITQFLMQGKDLGEIWGNLDDKFKTNVEQLIEDWCSKNASTSDDVIGKTGEIEEYINTNWADLQSDDLKSTNVKFGADITQVNLGDVNRSEIASKARQQRKATVEFADAVSDYMAKTGEKDPDKAGQAVRSALGLADEVILTAPEGKGGGNPPFIVANVSVGGKGK